MICQAHLIDFREIKNSLLIFSVGCIPLPQGGMHGGWGGGGNVVFRVLCQGVQIQFFTLFSSLNRVSVWKFFLEMLQRV